MKPHPEAANLLQAASSLRAVSLECDLFRLATPKYATAIDAINGLGAMKCDGRYHIKGRYRVAYTSESPELAIAEAVASARYYNLPLRTSFPKVALAVAVSLSKVYDLTDDKVLVELNVSRNALLDDWHKLNSKGEETLSQALGWVFFKVQAEALVVPSAQGAGKNVLLYSENFLAGSKVEALDGS
jgi:hypothetical protein